MEPSSFCTICTKNCKQELIGLLLSLSIHHKSSTIYVLTDTYTMNSIKSLTPIPPVNIIWNTCLDKYSNLSRFEMVKQKIWNEFQMFKAKAIEVALVDNDDTLFLDSDIIILDKINNIDKTKELGVSPQFIQQKYVDETGYYNGGMLWVKNKNVPNKWIEYTKTSRYHDQASIEDLVKEFSYFEFGENYNLQSWRFLLGLEPFDKIASHVSVKHGALFYKNERLKFIHTHFNDNRFKNINNYLISKMIEASLYKEILIIERMINDKWTIRIPKQPMSGLGHHANDSFRELAVMWMKHNDVKLELIDNSIHCWIHSSVILYDRPTLQWINNNVKNAKCLLMGNGRATEEIATLKDNGVNAQPWIFWPRRPMILEKLLEQPTLSYNERPIKTIFIGNYENSTQEKYRNNNNWSSVITEFHCTSGNKHKFKQQEYLSKLRTSKFGLCLRGYGSKCHREVELMAFGTVPLLTADVSVDYINSLQENIHYIKVNSPDDLKTKVDNMLESEWKILSDNCIKWYKTNVHSANSWNTTISSILY